MSYLEQTLQDLGSNSKIGLQIHTNKGLSRATNATVKQEPNESHYKQGKLMIKSLQHYD